MRFIYNEYNMDYFELLNNKNLNTLYAQRVKPCAAKFIKLNII